MIAQALPFQTGELALHIGADQTVSISATVRKKDMENSGLIPGSLRTALLFLPDHCMVYGTWLVELQGGSVILQCQEAKIADITLPDEMINPLSEQLGAAINHILQQQKISRIHCSGGWNPYNPAIEKSPQLLLRDCFQNLVEDYTAAA